MSQAGRTREEGIETSGARTFRALPETFPRRASMLRMTIVGVLCLSMIGAYCVFGGMTTPQIVMFFILTSAAGTVGIYKSMRQSVEQWYGSEWAIVGEQIEWRRPHCAAMRLARVDVIRIELMTDGSLIVRTSHSKQAIYIPRAVTNYDDLRRSLELWTTIVPNVPATTRHNATILAVVGLTVATFFTAVYGQRPTVVIPAAAIVVVGGIYCLFDLRRDPRMDRRVKRTAWVVCLIILAVLVRVVQVLR